MSHPEVVPLSAVRQLSDRRNGHPAFRVIDELRPSTAVRRLVLRGASADLPRTPGLRPVDVLLPHSGRVRGIAAVAGIRGRTAELLVDIPDLDGTSPARRAEAAGPIRRGRVDLSPAPLALPVGYRRYALLADETSLPTMVALARTAPREAQVRCHVRFEWSDTPRYVAPDGVAPEAEWWPMRSNGSELDDMVAALGALDSRVHVWAAGTAPRMDALRERLDATCAGGAACALRIIGSVPGRLPEVLVAEISIA